MAVKTNWSIEHACGHTALRDMSDKRADQRAEETSVIEAWERQAAMPPLTGSPKSVAWGQRCRHMVLSDAYAHHVLAGETTGEDWAERFEAAARTVTTASSWIDNRDSSPCDLAELLVAANSSRAADVVDNPY